MVSDEEVAYAILEPHFDAVRDVFADYEPEPGHALVKLNGTKLLVDSAVRDSQRHFAACRDDGLLIVLAPQAAYLDHNTLVPLICHEFGHAADFLYPARWELRRNRPAIWVPEGAPKMAKRRNAWNARNDDSVEWAADSIAQAVVGRPIQYCGPCMLQCFSGGQPRPSNLR